jgi:hypothetical protein
MKLRRENDGWRGGSEYAPLPRGRRDGRLTIHFPQHYLGIRRTMQVENPCSPLDKQINPHDFMIRGGAGAGGLRKLCNPILFGFKGRYKFRWRYLGRADSLFDAHK